MRIQFVNYFIQRRLPRVKIPSWQVQNGGLGSPGHFLFHASPLLSCQGIEDIGGLRVEFHHFLSDQRVLPALCLELLPLLDKVRVGQHLPVLRHLLDHSLVVTLNRTVIDYYIPGANIISQMIIFYLSAKITILHPGGTNITSRVPILHVGYQYYILITNITSWVPILHVWVPILHPGYQCYIPGTNITSRVPILHSGYQYYILITNFTSLVPKWHPGYQYYIPGINITSRVPIIHPWYQYYIPCVNIICWVTIFNPSYQYNSPGTNITFRVSILHPRYQYYILGTSITTWVPILISILIISKQTFFTGTI